MAMEELLSKLFSDLQQAQQAPIGTPEMQQGYAPIPSEDELQTRALREAFRNAGAALAGSPGGFGSALGKGVAAGLQTYGQMTDPQYRQGLLNDGYDRAKARQADHVSQLKTSFDSAIKMDGHSRKSKVQDQDLLIDAATEGRAVEDHGRKQKIDSLDLRLDEQQGQRDQELYNYERSTRGSRARSKAIQELDSLIAEQRKNMKIDDPEAYFNDEARQEATARLNEFARKKYNDADIYTKEYPALPKSQADLKNLPKDAVYESPPGSGKFYTNDKLGY